MSRHNTARQLYLLVNSAATRATITAAPRRVSGWGLLGALMLSVMLWAGLIWLGSLVLETFSR